MTICLSHMSKTCPRLLLALYLNVKPSNPRPSLLSKGGKWTNFNLAIRGDAAPIKPSSLCFSPLPTTFCAAIGLSPSSLLATTRDGVGLQQRCPLSAQKQFISKHQDSTSTLFPFNPFTSTGQGFFSPFFRPSCCFVLRGNEDLQFMKNALYLIWVFPLSVVIP